MPSTSLISLRVDFSFPPRKSVQSQFDYNKRNAFDIEKYRQHKLVVKPDDTFDLYDMGEVDAD